MLAHLKADTRGTTSGPAFSQGGESNSVECRGKWPGRARQAHCRKRSRVTRFNTVLARTVWVALMVPLGLALTFDPAKAGLLLGNPSNYKTLISSLAPGDTLRLLAGNYLRLSLSAVTGNPSAWITITGPTSGPAAVIQGEACCNTVQLYGCSYLAIRNLTIDGRGLDVDGVNAGPPPSHDILI